MRDTSALASWIVAGMMGVVLALAAPPSTARAQPAEEKTTAGEYNRRAIEAFKKGDFEVAQENFDRALALSPDPKIRLNLAVTQENLHRFDEAKMHYEAYLLTEKGEKAQDVRRKLKALEQKMHTWGKVVLSVEPPPDLVELSGRKLTARPVKVWLEAGEHGLIIEKAGYKRVQRLVSLAPGQRLDLQVRLEEQPSPPQPAATTPPPKQDPAPPLVAFEPPPLPPPEPATPAATPAPRAAPAEPATPSSAPPQAENPPQRAAATPSSDRPGALLRIGGVSTLVVALVAGAAALVGSVITGMIFTASIVRPPGSGAGLVIFRTVLVLGLLGITATTGTAFISAAGAMCLVVSAFLLG